MKPICFFDLETTGTDKTKDRIIEIAIDVHGITDEKVKDSPFFKDVAADISTFIKDCDLGGYNSNGFDIPFLYIEMNRAGIVLNFNGVRFFDACNIFKRKEERTLSAALKFYTGQLHDTAHSAMDDVLATIDVFNAQLIRYDDLKEKDLDGLALYCNYDNPRCDLSGNFQIDGDGDYVLTFGKHKGQKAKNVKDYLLWMMGQDFLPDTKAIIKSII